MTTELPPTPMTVENASAAQFEVLECDAVIPIRHRHRDIPKQFRRCPYCDGHISIHFEAWTKNNDGTWSAERAKADCETEPSMKDRRSDNWLKRHTYMPYVYWLPLEQALTDWANNHYRFNVEESQ